MIDESMLLRGKRILVTGAAGHIGKCLAEHLVGLGASLVLIDKDDEQLGMLREILTNGVNAKAEVRGYCCDFLNRAEILEMVSTFEGEGLIFHGLVNNASYVASNQIQGWTSTPESQTTCEWSNVFKVSIEAPFILTQALAKNAKINSPVSVVNLGSIYGSNGPRWDLYQGLPMGSPAAYAAAKAGLMGLTRWSATSFNPYVRVNMVSPGGVSRGQPKEFVDRYVSNTPLGRMALEEDIVGVVSFLLSDQSSYITGVELFVDGGWSAW